MKRSIKWTVAGFAVLALLSGSNLKAQTKDAHGIWRLGIGLEAGVPTGGISDFSKFELGGTARLQYDMPGNVSLLLTTGYYNLFKKNSSPVVGGDLGIVPLKFGVKDFFIPNWYVSGEVGPGWETNYGKNTKLILSPGIGYASNKGIDIGLRYENFSGQSDNYGMVGLRIAYGFRL